MSDDIERLCAQIRSGRHDGKLGLIQTAIQHRIVTGAARFRWTIAFGDFTVTEDDFTVDEAIEVENRLSTDTRRVHWGQIDPHVSAEMAKTVLAVAMEHRQNLSPDEVSKKLDVPMSQLLDGLSQYEVSPPDPSIAEPATT